MTPYHVRHPAPSTFDAPPILGAQDDPVLATLRSARRRYAKHGVEGSYLQTEPNDAGRRMVVAVCAAGALMVNDRKVRSVYEHGSGTTYEIWEEYARKSTKEALRLLNKSAEILYSHLLGDYGICDFGLIENINEGNIKDHPDFEDRHAMVLECYDHAIALRAGESS